MISRNLSRARERSAEGRVRATARHLATRVVDLLQHSRRFLQHVVIPEPQHPEALSGQPVGASLVVIAAERLIMLATVELDDQA